MSRVRVPLLTPVARPRSPLGRDVPEATVLEVLVGRHHLGLGVHHEGPGPGQRLPDRPSADDDDVEARGAALPGPVALPGTGEGKVVAAAEDRGLAGPDR